MRILLLLVLLLFPTSGGAAPSATLNAKHLIKALAQAETDKAIIAAKEIVWSDATLCFPNEKCRRLVDVPSSGIGIVSKTNFRGWSVRIRKAVIQCYVIERTKLYVDGHLSRDWAGGKARYTLTMRNGEWRIQEKKFQSFAWHKG